MRKVKKRGGLTPNPNNNSGGILRNSRQNPSQQQMQPMTLTSNRPVQHRASFSEDQHKGATRNITNVNIVGVGVADSSVASLSQGSQSDDHNGKDDSKFRGKRNSWHEPIWRVARPRLQTAGTEGLVTMANVERGSLRDVPNNSDAGSRGSNDATLEFCGSLKKCLNFVLDSCLWNVLVLLFTLVLLLGSSIQWYAKDGQAKNDFFDVLFFVTFLFLFSDIIMTSVVDAAYFPLYWKSYTDFVCGSFLFWFDVLGVASLLYNISFVNPRYNPDPDPIEISLSDEDYFKDEKKIHFNEMLVVTVVLRTMRAARFLNISSVLNFSNNFSAIFLHLLKTMSKKLKDLRSSKLCSSSSSKRPRLNKKSTGKSSNSVQMKTRDEHEMLLETREGKFNPNEAAFKIQRAWKKYSGTDDFQNASRQRSKDERKKTKYILRDRGRLSNNRLSLLRRSQAGGNFRKTRRKAPRFSEIGLAMNYITTKRVANGVLFIILLPLIFHNQEYHRTEPLVMVSYHQSLVMSKTALNSTEFERAERKFSENAFKVSGNLKRLEHRNGDYKSCLEPEGKKCYFDETWEDENCTHITKYVIEGETATNTTGYFDTRNDDIKKGTATLLFTIFFLIVWFLSLVVFAGPVTTLVVTPIERMIRLLGMLVKDPLGYENSRSYKVFASEEDDLAHNTVFTQDNLKGMETAFLMNSILRIGSLMKVGFGAAGVDIIRNSFKRGGIHHFKAISVSCIFLFCDIRQFTDTSECLQEEIFLFTNKIGEVVHSICHSFGGFANQNKGDAFLIIWKLDASSVNTICALNKEADSALFSVVQICMALNYDDYFLGDISEKAKAKMKKKFKDRKGNMVQIGFGLHAGRAVEGAIGSSRKLDATYLSNEVELAEFLESSTKKYGCSVLMSGAFFKLLHRTNQRRCRQVDEAFFAEEKDEEFDIDLFEIPEEEGETYMKIFTYDIELDALRNDNENDSQSDHLHLGPIMSERPTRRSHTNELRFSESVRNRRSFFGGGQFISQSANIASAFGGKRERKKMHFTKRLSILALRPTQDAVPENFVADLHDESPDATDELVLPSGPVRYHSSLWQSENIRKIRHKFTAKFLYNFELGLNAYLEGEWKEAKRHFEFMKQRYDDKPSKVLLEKMEEYNFIPPYKFRYVLGSV